MIFDRFYESVAAAPSVRTVVPTVLREHIVRFGAEMRAQETAVELVVDTQVLEVLLDDPAMQTVIDAFSDSEQMTVLAAELSMRFGVWETPEEAGVIVYTDTGPHSVLVNSRCAARRWARAVYEEAAADAVPLAECRGRRGS
jgi:TusA-related sulfurtransferase